MLTHIVFFKLKDSSPASVNQLREVLANMEGKIPQLLEIEVGADIARTERSFDLALVTKFHSMEDMKVYQVHPVHQKVLAYVGEVKDTIITVDYEG